MFPRRWQFGATAVFDDDDAEKNAIRYSDADIDDLLAKTAKPVEKKEDAASTFATAQIWVRDGGELNEFDAEKADEEAQPENLHDFWSKVVDQQQETERAQRAAQANLIGRGTRRRNQVRSCRLTRTARERFSDISGLRRSTTRSTWSLPRRKRPAAPLR